MDLTSLFEYLESHAPRCIQDHAQPADPEVVDFLRGKYGPDLVAFSCLGPGGASEYQVKAGVLDDHSGYCGPLVLRSPSSGEELLLFNPQEDGFSAEEGEGRLPGEYMGRIQCTNCGHDRFALTVGFGYAPAVLKVLSDETRDRPEDLFSFLVAAVHCGKCEAFIPFLATDC